MTPERTPAHRDARALAERFYAALERRDRETIEALFAPEATITIRLSLDGSPEPLAVFRGRQEAMAYVDSVLANFERIALRGMTYTVSEDAGTVFVEATGDLVTSGTGRPYRNVYVFRLDVRDGRITAIREYANPITFAGLGLAAAPAPSAG
ncbi:MAG: nuclear transport factor 2 family protein [Actinomycetes bacterium]